jgi:TM2 domain-containing membrane protein YozV
MAEDDKWINALTRATRQSECRKDLALVLSLFVGYLGVDRFYLGRHWTGFLKLSTFGGFGVWWLIDIVLIAAGGLTDAEGGHLS